MNAKLEEVLTKCKRGSDKATNGQECPSKTAYKISQDGSHVVILRCVKCSHQWSIPVGGSFSL